MGFPPLTGEEPEMDRWKSNQNQRWIYFAHVVDNDNVRSRFGYMLLTTDMSASDEEL
jgi:hypothetical protein